MLSKIWLWDPGKTYSESWGSKRLRILGFKKAPDPGTATLLATIQKAGRFANLDGMLGLQRAVGIEVGVWPGVGVHPDDRGTQ